MRARRLALWWSVPASLFAADALAWGLYTHVYFAQRLMAGACLPDLALVGATAGTGAFDASHRWDTAHALLAAAEDDAARACAVGAISHLWVDIIAHHLFRPPATVLRADNWLVAYVARSFDCAPQAARCVLCQLAGTEAVSRRSGVPRALNRVGRTFGRIRARRMRAPCDTRMKLR